METEPTKKRFDWEKLLTQSLNYAQYGRLITLLLCAGCLVGVSYFVFSTPLYSSTALININNFGLPISAETGTQISTPTARLNRRFVDYLRTERFIKEVAVDNGWARSTDSAAGVRESVVPVVRYNWLDSQTLQVMVMSRHVHVIREFPDRMVEVYSKDQRERRSKYRERGIELYLAELEELRDQLDLEFDKRFDLEKERDLTNLFIAQRNLTQVPKELVLVNSRIDQLDSGLQKLVESPEATTGITEKLAVVSTLEREALDMDDIGEFTRKKEGDGPLLDKPPRSVETAVLVQPILVENWETWERERRGLLEELKQQKKDFLDDHPSIRKLNEEIKALDQRLISEFDVRLRRLQIELVDLGERRGELQAKMPDYEKVTREYEEFRRDYDLLIKSELDWNKMFEKMSQQVAALEYGADKERMEITFGGFVNLRDENPVSPNKTKLAMISVALGFGLAFGVPILLNITNNTTNRIPDLEEASGVSGIGAVPLVDSKFLEDIVRSPMIDAQVPNSLLENFRLIRSNVCLHPNRKGKAKVIMVTSARPGEGKSTQAANLAWAFFSMGERTLLIDCDLRRGRQHELCGVSNQKGMSHLLTRGGSLNDVILKTENENLDVIPRGPIVAGSTEVLCQEFFDRVVEVLSESYERIVIDTPPVLGLSETASLQRLTDGVVLVVRAETTPQRDSIDAIDKLRKAGAHLFGFVLNGIDLKKLVNRYHYYYYSSDYYDSFADDVAPDESIGSYEDRLAPPDHGNNSEDAPLAAVNDAEFIDGTLVNQAKEPNA